MHLILSTCMLLASCKIQQQDHLVNSSRKLQSQIFGRFLVSLLPPTLQAITRQVVCFILHSVVYRDAS
jgi:hypothetical protein